MPSDRQIRKDLDARTRRSPRALSPRIRAHCIECMGFQPAEVRRCTSPACYLYPWRSGHFSAEAQEEQEAAHDKRRSP
uniref:Uncharacterized protein n=1 Tax=viral metagenome TaxID=1070528 RepID=A0A6M3L192_9ZZZZ